MKLKNQITTLVGVLVSIATLNAADITAPRIINTTTTWTADNTYFLDGYTFVVTPPGASEPTTLIIEPGTVIKGKSSAGANAAALIITRNAKIHANGTAMRPIIFTSELDDLNGSLGPNDHGLWGGVVILGNAVINSRADSKIVPAPVVDQVEGIEVTGDEIDYASFGGTNDDDDSGVLRYVSIRHGGASIGGDNEINGLTLGGIGRNTTIEYIEVFANKDDGVEFFGGVVDVRHVVLAYGKDDGIDYDQGWRGRGQYILVIGNDSGDDRSDKGGELDGATAPLDAEPFGGGVFYNVTLIGIGDSKQPDGSNGRSNVALNIRDNAGAKFYNSIFVDFAKMIDIEDDNLDRFNAGDVDFRNNVWWSHIPANNSADGFNNRPNGVVNPDVFWTDTSRDNKIADPMLRGISRAANGGFDPRPQPGSPALTEPFATVPGNDFFEQTNYKGAFAPEVNWLIGWTKLSTEGYLASNAASYVLTDEYGWLYTPNGSIAPGNWVYIVSLHSWAYISRNDRDGDWLFIAR